MATPGELWCWFPAGFTDSNCDIADDFLSGVALGFSVAASSSGFLLFMLSMILVIWVERDKWRTSLASTRPGCERTAGMGLFC